MYTLKDTLITGTNVQVTCEDKDNNSLWGISFIASEDNSEYLALISEHVTDEELVAITEQIEAIEIPETE